MIEQKSPMTTPFRSLLSSVICQGIGICSAVLIWKIFPIFLVGGMVYSLTALAMAWFLRLPTIWLLFNAILPLTLWFLQPEAGYGWLALVAVTALLLLFLPTLLSGVPYYPSSPEAFRIVADQLPSTYRFKFIDLGCGFSGMLLYLAARSPQGSFTGIEISPFAYLVSKLRVFLSRRKNIEIRFVDIWKTNFGDYDVVYAFLSPLVMEKLEKKINLEMNENTLFISNSFEISAMPDQVFELKDDRKCRILTYRR